MPQYKLTYFNARGRAEVIRFLFALADVAYEDCRIEMDDWPALKPKSQFGVAPWLEEDGKMICQSHAIERYLARKFGYSGSTDWEQARTDMVVECVEDITRPLIAVRRETNQETKEELTRKYVEEQVPQFLHSLEMILRESDQGPDGYFVGNQLGLADLVFTHYTTNNSIFLGRDVPASWDKWPGLKAVRENVTNHSKIKAWVAKRPDTNL